MESLVPVWMGELAKQGPGWILFCLSCVVIWWQNKEIRELRILSRTDAEQMTKTIVHASMVLEKFSEVHRERTEAERKVGEILQALDKRTEISDRVALERAQGIQTQIRDSFKTVMDKTSDLFARTRRE